MKQTESIQINPYTLMAQIGLEKESLRITEDGRLAQTSHPFPLDPHLDVDFSENQMEIITGIQDSPAKVYDELYRLHQKVARELHHRPSGREFLWPFSNPPYVEGYSENLPMQFQGENRWKTEYRCHLQRCYGTRLMLYSGIHFNFSFTEEFFHVLEAQGIHRDSAYLNLAAWSTRYAWLIVYLFAASSVMDSSFTSTSETSGVLRMSEANTAAGTFHDEVSKKYSSPRCSEIGYWNTFDPILDYHDLLSYIRSICRYVEDGTLMYPAELYYPVRLKPSGRYSMEALEAQGVNHIEIRVIDENPYSPVGITCEDIQFLHLLMVFLMHQPLKDFSPQEQMQSLHDMKKAARYNDELPLSSGMSLRASAKDALHRIEGFFCKGAFSQVERAYIRSTLDYQWQKFRPGQRRAELVRKDFEDDYCQKGLALAREHSEALRHW